MLDKRIVTSLAYITVSLLAQVGCSLLLILSQFGQSPLPELPLIMVLMFGALFVGPLYSLRRRLGSAALLTLSASLLLNIALWAALSTWTNSSPLYLFAPLTALVLVELYPVLFKRHAALVAAMTVYIVCTLLANYTLDSFLPLPGYGLVNVGTLFFGITFTQRDRVHRYGRSAAYLMIGIAAVANVIIALSVATPLRYVVVGFSAIILSEAADTEVYQRFIRRRWLTRVATSNAISIPIDTLIFTVFAFYGEPFANPAWMLEVIVTDIIVKLIVGFVAAWRILGSERLAKGLRVGS